MNVHCVHCGHTIDLNDTYDSYTGPLRCAVCKNLMQIHIEDGQLRSMQPARQCPPEASPDAHAPHSH